MAQGDINITVVGNVVSDPELRYTSNGTPVASFRIVSNTRRYDQATNTWVDGTSTFLSCSAWRNLGQNVASSITKGMRVIVTGVFRDASYTDNQGNNRTAYEILVDDIGPSLRYATAEVTRLSQSGGGFQSQQAAPQAPVGGQDGGFSKPPVQDPWATGDAGFNQGNSQAQPPF